MPDIDASKVVVDDRDRRAPAQVAADDNASAIDAALGAAMASLAAIAATPAPAAGNLTAAALSNHVSALHAAVVQMATIQRRSVRVQRRDYSGTD